MDESVQTRDDSQSWRVFGIPFGRPELLDWYFERYWDAHASFATTSLHQTLRDGFSDTVLMGKMQWKRRDKNRVWDRNYRLRQYQHERSQTPKRPMQRPAEYVCLKAYRYAHLGQTGDMRLLRLLPGTTKAPIACEFVQVNTLDSNSELPSYEALSYTWGPRVPHTISCNGACLSISENLWLALQSIRRTDRERLLWVDAVCINQNDVTEKTSQVQQMKNIYASGSSVIVWLGEADDDTGVAFDLIEQLSKAYGFENNLVTAMTADEMKIAGLPDREATVWKALDKLFWRDWYFRAWILHEVVQSRSSTMICGSYSATYNSFVRASKFIDRRSLTALVDVDPLPLRNIVEVETWTWHEQDRKLFENVGYSGLLGILSRGRNSSATDPRDKVFALLGLIAQDEQLAPAIKADYAKSVEEVFIVVATQYISVTRSLNVLSAVEDEGYRLNARLPSWVPGWEVHPTATPFATLHPFVMWNAAGSSTVSGQNLPRNQRGARLRTLGSVIDQCIHTADTFLEHLPSSGAFKSFSTGHVGQHVFDFFMQRRWRQWAKLAHKVGTEYPTGESIKEAYARTIIADQLLAEEALTGTGNIDTDALKYYDAFIDFWSNAKGLNVKNPHSDHMALPTERLQRALLFMDLYKDAAYGRRFFITKKGYMGLCHPSVRAGDQVVLLAGGRTPYVMKAKGFRGSRWRFGGECYLHGRMNGEAMKDAADGVFANECWFDIE